MADWLKGVLRGAAGLLASAIALAQPVHAQETVDAGRTQARLIAERTMAAPGDVFLAALQLDVDPGGWHVYWKNVGDSGLPPRIDWTLPDGVTTGPFVWPAPHAIPLATLMNYGYEGQLVLPFEVRIPENAPTGGDIVLKANASWLVCLEVCIPEQASLSLTVPIGAAVAQDDGASRLIAASLEQSPRPITGAAFVARTQKGYRLAILDPDVAAAAEAAQSIRFFPDGHEIVHFADQPAERGEDGVTLELEASQFADEGATGLSGVIVAELDGGERAAFSLSASAGELPSGAAGIRMTGAGGESVTAVGILGLLVAAFAGGLVLNLMPCVLPVLSVKAAGLVKSAHHPAEARAHGLAYTAGVLACFALVGAVLVGLRMAGEQAGLGFQLQYPAMTALFALVMFAVGLNLLGLYTIGGSLMGVGSGLAGQSGAGGAFFTGALAAFVGAPCVGPFMAPAVGVALAQPAPVVIGVFLMIGLGMAAPFLALSFTPAFARILPKPGAWMESFRQALSFPMFATALWLLWVLMGQAGSEAAVLTLAGALGLAFAVWLGRQLPESRVGRGLIALIAIFSFVGPACMSADLRAPEAAESAASAPLAYETAAWSPEEVARYRAEGRVVFVDFTARWCATCQVNKKLAIQSDEAAKAFAAHDVVLLTADWTNRDDVIASALADFGRAGVPLYLVYPASGGAPEILPQMLSPGLVRRAVETAAQS
jgi:thiol:disulfide interchange protein DsbD